jgi:uncharacterized protein (DUF58 family)
MSRFLPANYLRRLANYEFAAKALVEGYLSGQHRSKERGASIEFHEYRSYTPGDDPALVDWRVFARTDRHYLRTFEMETNLECHLFVDSSASMGFRGQGELTKLEFASFFAACLAWLVVRHHDRVSLHLFAEKVRKHFAPGSTRQHLRELLNALESNQPGQTTNLPEALVRANPLIKRKGTLVVLSDFLDRPEEVFKALNPYLHRGFRVHLFQIVAPEELDLPNGGLLRFQDLETAERLTIHSASVRETYREAMKNHLQAYRRLAASRQVDYAIARTDESFFTLFDRLAA